MQMFTGKIKEKQGDTREADGDLRRREGAECTKLRLQIRRKKRYFLKRGFTYHESKYNRS